MWLIFNRINDFVVVQNGKAEQAVGTRTGNGANKKLVFHVHQIQVYKFIVLSKMQSNEAILCFL